MLAATLLGLEGTDLVVALEVAALASLGGTDARVVVGLRVVLDAMPCLVPHGAHVLAPLDEGAVVRGVGGWPGERSLPGTAGRDLYP